MLVSVYVMVLLLPPRTAAGVTLVITGAGWITPVDELPKLVSRIPPV